MGVIFLSGVYGVGKSTLATEISKSLNIPHYSASDLITQRNGEKYGANKIVKDKAQNQQILIDNVKQLLLHNERFILDGHFCIFNRQKEVEKLPEFVFKKILIEQIILLKAELDNVKDNLAKRDSSEYTVKQLTILQRQELRYAKTIAKELRVPIVIHTMEYNGEDFDKVLNLIQ